MTVTLLRGGDADSVGNLDRRLQMLLVIFWSGLPDICAMKEFLARCELVNPWLLKSGGGDLKF